MILIASALGKVGYADIKVPFFCCPLCDAAGVCARVDFFARPRYSPSSKGPCRSFKEARVMDHCYQGEFREYPHGVGQPQTTFYKKYAVSDRLGFTEADELALSHMRAIATRYPEDHPEMQATLQNLRRPFSSKIDPPKSDEGGWFYVYPKVNER